MSVELRAMTVEAYEFFYRWSVEQQARERMEEAYIPWKEAVRESMSEIAKMLPDGLYTEQNYLMTIEETDSREAVGFLWTIHEETAGRKQSFVCDFAIWEPYRRKGYGTEALYQAERKAAAAGCQESVLFVADRNTAAQTLYKKCGYQILRQAGCGSYMIKQL